jgi:4'-phosphopantetheinyl transferase
MVYALHKALPLPGISTLGGCPELKHGQIDIWFATVDRPPSDIRGFEAALSREEAIRARRFKASRDRNRYVVRHGILRTLLARYIGCELHQVDIRCEPNGKPYLADQRNEGWLQFSSSHSETCAAFAFCRGNSVGVDIEKMRELPEMLEIVARHFTPYENCEMLSCPGDLRSVLFYRFWTRKEAVLKTQGEGLLRPLSSVDVAGSEGCGGPLKVRIAGCPAAGVFSVLDIKGPTGFAAALAMDGQVANISVRPRWIWEA